MNKHQIIDDFSTFISFQSVAAGSTHGEQINQAVSFLVNTLQSIGFEVELISPPRTDRQLDSSTKLQDDGLIPPIVIAQYRVSSDAKTMAVYGHYDVQPEDPIEEWQTDPFNLTLKNGKFYGRGTADDKGHIIQNIAAIEELIKENRLDKNVIFIVEGEEEVGSPNFEALLESRIDLLKDVDYFFITDTGMFKKNVPQIYYGLRGIVYFELEVIVGERDIHSGIFGNRVYNPIQIIADLLSQIKDSKTGKILIQDFYNDVRKITKAEIDLLQKVVEADEQLMKNANSYGVINTYDVPAGLASKIYPAFDANGIVSGYTGDGAKTIIPKSARVKFSFRIMEHQDPSKISKSVEQFISENIPKGVKYKLNCLAGESAFYTDVDNEYTQKTARILSEHFGNQCLFNRSGGSIPAAEILQRLFHKPVILTGFTLPDSQAHSPNENFDEEMFWKGIEALKKIYGSDI